MSVITAPPPGPPPGSPPGPPPGSPPGPSQGRSPSPVPAAAPTRASRPVRAADKVLEIFDAIYDQIAFYVRALVSLPKGLRYWNEILAQISDITLGAGALIVGGGTFLVVAGITFFTGTLVGLEGYAGLHQVGAQAFTGLISSLANTREITPIVAGQVLAAQVGAGFTAQLGSMRISAEIDALEVMGVDSFVYLVTTRVWSLLIAIVPLYLAALFASFYATQVISTHFFHLSSGVYHHYFQLFLPPIDVLDSLIKAMVFAVFVALVHTYYGYRARGGPAGVGVSAGRALRVSITGIVLINLLLSMIMFGGPSATARLVG